MNEGLPEPDWQRREAAVAQAREAVGTGYQFGTISVKYDGDFAAVGAVWLKANCSQCNATTVMQASHPLHVRQIALDLARYGCSKFEHEQDLGVLQRQIDYELGGTWVEDGEYE